MQNPHNHLFYGRFVRSVRVLYNYVKQKALFYFCLCVFAPNFKNTAKVIDGKCNIFYVHFNLWCMPMNTKTSTLYNKLFIWNQSVLVGAPVHVFRCFANKWTERLPWQFAIGRLQLQLAVKKPQSFYVIASKMVKMSRTHINASISIVIN